MKSSKRQVTFISLIFLLKCFPKSTAKLIRLISGKWNKASIFWTFEAEYGSSFRLKFVDLHLNDIFALEDAYATLEHFFFLLCQVITFDSLCQDFAVSTVKRFLVNRMCCFNHYRKSNK